MGEATTGFLDADFRFAGAVDFGFAAGFVRLAAGRLAATAREDLGLPALPTAAFEIFFAFAGFGATAFADLDFFVFFAGATTGLTALAFAGFEGLTGLAFAGLADVLSAFLRFGAVAVTGTDFPFFLTLGFAFMLGWSAFLMQLNERAVCRSSTTTERLVSSASFKMQMTLAAFCFTHFARLCFLISVQIESVSPKQIAE